MAAITYNKADLIRRPLWWQKQGLSYTASGYGAKIPTPWVLHYGHRYYRVYSAIYSNTGSNYILVGGKKRIIEDFPED